MPQKRYFRRLARKLPVQLNRKQYENLFESFDYTKEATVDVGKSEGKVGGQRGRGHIPRWRSETGSLRGGRKQWATIRLAKRDRIFTFKLNYFLRFVYD